MQHGHQTSLSTSDTVAAEAADTISECVLCFKCAAEGSQLAALLLHNYLRPRIRQRRRFNICNSGEACDMAYALPHRHTSRQGSARGCRCSSAGGRCER
jgi:succinate dehydrogenase/fumarate reductase-like Fe-S protein